MSDQTQVSNQQTLVIGLAIIAALLMGIIGVLIYQQTRGTTPEMTSTNSTSSSTQPPAGMGATPASTAFDAKTATKVAKGKTPEQHLKEYNEAIIKGQFAKAYDLLPLDKKQSYGDAKAYESQVKAYNITEYKMGKPLTEKDTCTIVTEQVTPQMPIAYTWTFKKISGTWYVQSRTMGGAIQ